LSEYQFKFVTSIVTQRRRKFQISDSIDRETDDYSIEGHVFPGGAIEFWTLPEKSVYYDSSEKLKELQECLNDIVASSGFDD